MFILVGSQRVRGHVCGHGHCFLYGLPSFFQSSSFLVYIAGSSAHPYCNVTLGTLHDTTCKSLALFDEECIAGVSKNKMAKKLCDP